MVHCRADAGLLLLVGAAALVYRKYGLDWPRIEADFFANLVTDLVGIVFAILVLDTLTEQRVARERKRAIIQQMGSPVNDAALEAVRIARLEGWLEDGSLRGATLEFANLEEAYLRGCESGRGESGQRQPSTSIPAATLQGASLRTASLQRANLVAANMEGVNLAAANLEKAILVTANLRRANHSAERQPLDA